MMTNSTGVPTSIDRLPSAICVQWKKCSVPASDRTVPYPACSSKAATTPLVVSTELITGSAQWTILAIGNSMMSVAPRSLRAGISVLISDLGTTVSTA